MFNYYFDADRDGHADTIRMFEAIGKGEYEGYTSRYVTFELLKTEEPKRANMMKLIEKYNITVLDFHDEANRLANIYVRNKVIPEKFLLDGAHIAISSIHELDCILSFNYQHINKLKTKRMTELINLSEGYKRIAICTPMEVLDYEEAE
ncbi:MAG: hypothetical protein FWF85_00775 [Clostridiales bacterium]|nr:hypothetical protein [Clostridiales bacterium]